MKTDMNVSDIFLHFTKILFELSALGEKLKEKEVVAKLLWSMSIMYDSLTFFVLNNLET